MLSVVYTDVPNRRLGFISDAKDPAAQLIELQNPDPKEISRLAKENLNMMEPGINDTQRAHYNCVTQKPLFGRLDTAKLAIDGNPEVRAMYVITFDSILGS